MAAEDWDVYKNPGSASIRNDSSRASAKFQETAAAL